MASGSPAKPGVLSRQLDSPTRVDEITDRLITAIAVGEYLPGARLPVERELAEALGVGRMTVRAALARLVERGVLETRRGRGGGSYVREQWPDSVAGALGRTLSIRLEELRDRCDAICRLHGAVCRAAAEARTEADVAILRGCLEDYRRAASGESAQQADSRLHVAIMEAAHNAVLKQVLVDLEASVSVGAPVHPWGEPSTMRAMELRALRDHELLVDAIEHRRPDDADEIARAHVAIDFELISAALRRAGVLTD
ncbi:GntR family transcriptional regulator [Mycolicibacterium chubuense]|uniref:Putative L-lactate dehydrogenase operon regulatory protein n=1 Tax=Mycolicibacterium chubuense TaxID=1800 RepID=A0A0J6WM39_MYCCU|nr:GntR family transcriptional regulator [Mycolicibacterium chubuense]KMO84435.1 putative L-lactate dehydrogenase operon regulatory protein [Mycolicibacterium chubuense]ORA53871.1 GntR family transcriptional regulator [Mycolicibacterium chubuense]SPX95334.1 transcriptional regulator [Mycolicibacterium chubuense]